SPSSFVMLSGGMGRKAGWAGQALVSRLSRPSCPSRASEISSVNLRALEPSAEIDVHRFPFREDVERGRARFAMAVAGCLRATEGQMHFGADGRRVDVKDPGVEIAHRRERAVDILSVDRSGQTVLHGIADGDRLIERSAANNRQDRKSTRLNSSHVAISYDVFC